MSAKMEADIQKLFALHAQHVQLTTAALNAIVERLERLEPGEDVVEKAAPNGQIKKAKADRR